MIMRMVILGVGVPGMGGIRGLPGITGTEDGGCRLDFRGDRLRNRFTRPYRSGPSPHWVKVKNPIAPAVTREPRRIGAVNPGCSIDHPRHLASAATAIALRPALEQPFLPE